MTIRLPIESEIEEYIKEQERKDTKIFDTYVDKLSPVQHLYLLQILLDAYSPSSLVEVLDDALEQPLKEELGDLWNFRSTHGIGD